MIKVLLSQGADTKQTKLALFYFTHYCNLGTTYNNKKSVIVIQLLFFSHCHCCSSSRFFSEAFKSFGILGTDLKKRPISADVDHRYIYILFSFLSSQPIVVIFVCVQERQKTVHRCCHCRSLNCPQLCSLISAQLVQ